PETPVAEPETPVAEPETPVAEPETPEPDTETDVAIVTPPTDPTAPTDEEDQAVVDPPEPVDPGRDDSLITPVTDPVLPPPPPEEPAAPIEPEEPPAPQIPPDEVLFGAVGDLVPGSGQGYREETIFAEGLRYPLETSPSFPNSQVWGIGGFRSPRPGGQCDTANYSYPWRDNFCETRGYAASLCPTGKGHQGQDIRPATCEKDKHWAVAVESGQVTSIGRYTVTMVGSSGREYRYMHLNMNRLLVGKGDRVLRGDRIGLVSNFFGGTPTTIHLHFEIRQVMRDANGRVTKRFVPPYTSLRDAYRRLLISEAALAAEAAASGN
ncbi:MAG: M23 family metallopeptidase, partial [Pseudomonadota bacterium]